MKYTHVCLDIETTGLNHKQDEVIEICAIRFNMDGLIDPEQFFYRCGTKYGSISEGAQKVHGISAKDIEGFPGYLEANLHKKLAEYIGELVTIGHNIIAFDSKFIKVIPKKMEDTLLMARKRWPGGRNRLGSVCSKLGIGYEEDKAHAAVYDVRKTIEVYIKMVNDSKNTSIKQESLFDISRNADIVEAIAEEDASEEVMDGITLTEGDEVIATGSEVPVIENIICSTVLDRNYEDTCEAIHNEIPLDLEARKKWAEGIMATQSYSYSRINTFIKCPFSWYNQYVLGKKQLNKAPLTTGKICHTVAEYTAKWVSMDNYYRKFSAWADRFSFDLKQYPKLINLVATKQRKPEEDINIRDIAFWLYDNFTILVKTDMNPFKWVDHAQMFRELDESVDKETFRETTMPPSEMFGRMIQKAAIDEKCNDSQIIRDAEFILWKFYRMSDFSREKLGDIVLPERRFAFDRNWNVLSDFYSKKAFFRGIIDLIELMDGFVTVTDYKTDRSIGNPEHIKTDPQLNLYIMAVYLLTGKRDAVYVAKKNYLRFGAELKHVCQDPQEISNTMKTWVEENVKAIETELMKPPTEAFKPTRNEYCGTCFLAENLTCPLFNKRTNNDISDVSTYEVKDVHSAKHAWKRIEANKNENSLLQKRIKAFLESTTERIFIDEKAELDFYNQKTIDIDTQKLIDVFVSKVKSGCWSGVSTSNLTNYLSITESNFEKMLSKLKISFSPEEMEQFVSYGTKKSLNAYTVEEAKKKDFIGSHVESTPISGDGMHVPEAE